MNHISIEDFHQVVLDKGAGNVNIVDVRTPEKFASGHIKGAINLPLSQLEANLDQLEKTNHYYVICQAERFSRQRTEILTNNVFESTNVTAGMNDYHWETISSS